MQPPKNSLSTGLGIGLGVGCITWAPWFMDADRPVLGALLNVLGVLMFFAGLDFRFQHRKPQDGHESGL